MLKKMSADGAVTEFSYDANGFLKLAKNQWITIEFERDAYGRVLREKQGDQVIESVYDGRGLRTKRLVNGQEVNWRYDANGQLEALSLPGDGLARVQTGCHRTGYRTPLKRIGAE